MPAKLVTPAPLDPQPLHRLEADGFLLLRHAVAPSDIAALRAAFDAGVLASTAWPAPRGREWRHALVDTDPDVQRICRLPALMAAAGHILKSPFFLSQVEGREPLRGNAPQPLHRDAAGCPGQLVAAMIWLDPYGPDNGATQVVPGSHRRDDIADDPTVLSGAAGDILIFDPDLLHGATTNQSGARRRSLLLSYAVATLQAQHRETAALRGVRMDISEIFQA